ncbi:MAG: sugar ABC transporter ATP-binding protein [Pirellulales bacterium]
MNLVSPDAAPPAPLLALRGIEKRFPGVFALRGVDLEVRAGEVHALLGENGAGKSTLMHVLAGVFPPDGGRIDFAGQEHAAFANERAALEAGVALVYQERSLFGPLSVAENIFAGRQPRTRFRRIDYRRLHDESRKLLHEVGLDVDPQTPLERLSSAQQQLVEVAKALSVQAKLILFDEPTAALAPAEAERLFGLIRKLRAAGVGVVYISHRLEEVFALADRATVLKDGQGQGTFALSELSPQRLINLMVGRELNPHQPRADTAPADSPPLLQVRSLSDPADGAPRKPRLENVGFDVRAGEIVGLAGLVGAGRSETALALFGARPGCRGEILVDGRTVQPGSPAAAIAAGIGYLPEDRKLSGLFLDMSIADNVASAAGRRFGVWRFRGGEQRAKARELCSALRVVCRGPDEPVKNLSGGNQQKVILARWLLADPRVLLVDEPTRGVDVGAKAEIHQLLYEQARRGKAVVVISSDMLELLAVSDRIVVMCEGRVTGELSRAEATEAKVVGLASQFRQAGARAAG